MNTVLWVVTVVLVALCSYQFGWGRGFDHVWSKVKGHLR